MSSPIDQNWRPPQKEPSIYPKLVLAVIVGICILSYVTYQRNKSESRLSEIISNGNIEKITELQVNGTWHEREAATKLLNENSEARSTALKILSNKISYDNVQIRLDAISSLDKITDPLTLDILRTAIQDNEWKVRFNAGHAIGRKIEFINSELVPVTLKKQNNNYQLKFNFNIYQHYGEANDFEGLPVKELLECIAHYYGIEMIESNIKRSVPYINIVIIGKPLIAYYKGGGKSAAAYTGASVDLRVTITNEQGESLYWSDQSTIKPSSSYRRKIFDGPEDAPFFSAYSQRLLCKFLLNYFSNNSTLPNSEIIKLARYAFINGANVPSMQDMKKENKEMYESIDKEIRLAFDEMLRSLGTISSK